MKKNIMMALVVIIAAMFLMTGCSGRNGNGSNATVIGPGKTAKDTVSAVLTNTEYPSGIQVNWRSKVSGSDATLSGLQQLAFIIDGDEIIDGVFEDKALSSIKLEFTGQTSGKKVSLDTSLIGAATNLGADSDYFKVDGNTFYFYPHYFSVGEEVAIKAIFTYKGDGIVNQIFDGKTVEGYLVFTVGEDTKETFSNPLSDFSKKVKDFFDGLGNDTGDNSSSTNPTDSENEDNTRGSNWELESGMFFTDVRYRVNGQEKDYLIQKYQEDSVASPIKITGTNVSLTVYTRECDYDIVKAYIEFPNGTDATWSNDWFEDNCHKFDLDLSAYSGQTVTLRIRLLAGSELWQNEYMYGFITVQVP